MDAGGSKRKICHGRHTGYDHNVDDDGGDIDEEKKMEIFCAIISTTRDHILNNINAVSGSSCPELLSRSQWPAPPPSKKTKTAVVDVDPDYCNNAYKPPNIINYHHKAAAWQPSFQHEDFLKVDGDNKIQAASRSTRSPGKNMSVILTTRPSHAAAAASPPPPPPPPLMMAKQPNGDNKVADHAPKDALDLKLSL